MRDLIKNKISTLALSQSPSIKIYGNGNNQRY